MAQLRAPSSAAYCTSHPPPPPQKKAPRTLSQPSQLPVFMVVMHKPGGHSNSMPACHARPIAACNDMVQATE